MDKYIRNITFPVNKILFDHYSALGLDESELIILIKLMQHHSDTRPLPDITQLIEGTTLSGKSINMIIQQLISKSFIEIYNETTGDGHREVLSVAPAYEKVAAFISPDKNDVKDEHQIQELFSFVENLYGRALSPSEFERMNSWLSDSNYSVDMIKESVNLAYKNQITSLQYVERILNNLNRTPLEPKRERPPVRNWLKGESLDD
ncbi:DnaD domain-containing protein [Lacicoccus alkaliphilus]|uniref:DNA replication protein n=1 Tax=Lacicoccus alkaliphilus DSM 16010 TaxID=1123231 RepID=A0A1M7B7Y9_9BACL|nr:DnaD domain protein [Salinicoccus alkaliphilus]SHL51135.1 DNA replication protein [Salinicoccus alkaliphilus DSM 16010]